MGRGVAVEMEGKRRQREKEREEECVETRVVVRSDTWEAVL